MANKPSLSTVNGNAVYSAATLNKIFDDLATAIEGSVGRGGTTESPNSMLGALDMNLNKIQNLPTPTASKDAANKSYVDNILTNILPIGSSSVTTVKSGGNAVDWDAVNSNLITTTVGNCGELRGLTAFSDGDSVILLGRTIKGDGGGGEFYWDSSNLSSEVTADTVSGVYIAPNSDLTGASGAWVRTFSGKITVEMFGAIGDWNGATGTDNSVALQAAFDWAAANRVPLTDSGGLYALSTNGVILRSNLDFKGSGQYIQNYQVNVEPKSESLFRNESWNTEFGEDNNIRLSGFSMANGPTITGGSFITINKAKNYNISHIYARKSSENTALNIGGIEITLDNIRIKNLPGDTGKIDGIHFEYIEDATLSNLDIHSQDDCLGFAYFPAIIPPRDAAEAIANVAWGRDLPSRNITVTNATLHSDIANGIRIGNWANFEDLNQYMMPEGRYENMTFSNIVFNKIGATGSSVILEDYRHGASEITSPHNEIRFNNLVVNDFTSATEALITIQGNAFLKGFFNYAAAGTDRNFKRVFFNGVSGMHSSAGQTVNANGIEEVTFTDLSVSRGAAGDNEFITQLVDRIRVNNSFIKSMALSGTSNTMFIRDFGELFISGGQIAGTGIEVAAVRLQQPNLVSGGRVIIQGTTFDGQIGGVAAVSALTLDEIQVDANLTGITGAARTNITATTNDSAPLHTFHANVSGSAENECRRTNNLGTVMARITLSGAINAGELVAAFPVGVEPINTNSIRAFLVNTSGVQFSIDYSNAVGIRSQSPLVAGTYSLSLSYPIKKY